MRASSKIPDFSTTVIRDNHHTDVYGAARMTSALLSNSNGPGTDNVNIHKHTNIDINSFNIVS